MSQRSMTELRNLLHQDYFSVFGLPEALELDLIKLQQSYLDLQRQCHPDLFFGQPEAADYQQIFTYINQGYQTLYHWLSRVAYILTQHHHNQQNSETVDPEFMELLMQLDTPEQIDAQIAELRTSMRSSFTIQDFGLLATQYNKIKYLIRTKERLNSAF